MLHINTKIKEEFNCEGFRVVPVLIYNKFQHVSFYRYLIYFKDSSLGYINDYMKLTKEYFRESFNNGDYKLHNYSNLSMLEYN